MLFSEYRKSSENNGGAAGVVTFKGRGIRSQGVVAYSFDITTGQFSDISNIKVYAGGATIFNCSGVQLKAMIYRLSRSNYLIPAAATRFTIPFYALDLPANDPDGKPPRSPEEGMLRYNQQFPGKLEPQIEITSTASMVAIIGTHFTDEPAFVYPTFLSSGLGSPAGAGTNQTFDITNPGLIRGFTFPVLGLDRLRLDFASRQRFEWNKNLFIEDGQMENGDLATLNEPTFVKIHGPEEALKTSRFEFDAGAAWPASTQAAIYSILPQP